MNWLEQAKRIHREAGRSGDGPTALASANKDQLRLFDWANDAYLNVQSMPREWRWMLRSLDGTATPVSQEYTGTDLGAVSFGRWRTHGRTYTVRAYLPASPTSVWRLKWIGEDEFIQRFQDSAVMPGPPQVWSISRNNTLLIGPVPDQNYQIKADYLIEPQVMAVDTDAPALPVRFHMLLVWRALCEVAKYDAAPELLARATYNHDTMLANLITDQAAPIDLQITPLGGSQWASARSLT